MPCPPPSQHPSRYFCVVRSRARTLTSAPSYSLYLTTPPSLLSPGIFTLREAETPIFFFLFLSFSLSLPLAWNSQLAPTGRSSDQFVCRVPHSSNPSIFILHSLCRTGEPGQSPCNQFYVPLHLPLPECVMRQPISSFTRLPASHSCGPKTQP